MDRDLFERNFGVYDADAMYDSCIQYVIKTRSFQLLVEPLL